LLRNLKVQHRLHKILPPDTFLIQLSTVYTIKQISLGHSSLPLPRLVSSRDVYRLAVPCNYFLFAPCISYVLLNSGCMKGWMDGRMVVGFFVYFDILSVTCRPRWCSG
jgi:hypothetical protein